MKKGILLFGLCLLIIGCITFVESENKTKYNNTLRFKETSENNTTLFTMRMLRPDYSKEGYIQISPGNTTKFIYLECINSTLVINNNSIYCTNTQ